MASNPTVARAIGGLLLLIGIALIVVALVRDGNNMWIALGAVPAAFASSACFASARKRRGAAR